MAVASSQTADQEWLLCRLRECLDPANTNRAVAEEALRQAEAMAGYAPALMGVAGNKSLDAGTRQISSSPSASTRPECTSDLTPQQAPV
ncbi:unnamed protein product [Closterium sp. Yama58-4]|nr:unnamed protein product [Closterium sp. Yama58-4]